MAGAVSCLGLIRQEFLNILLVIFLIETVFSQTYCGEMKINNSVESIEITLSEKRTISQTVYDRIYVNRGAAVIVNATKEKCTVEVCGFSLGNFRPQHGECQYFSEPEWSPVQPETGQTMFQISSISCGCDKNRPNCKSDQCATKEIAVPPGSEGEQCGVLYQETNCQDCFYDGIPLFDGGSHKSPHSTAIKSFFVLEGCIITKTIYGYLSEDIPESFERIEYNKSESTVPLSYHKQGEEFHCKCYPPVTGESSTTLTPNGKIPAIIGGVGGSIALLMIIASVGIIVKIRNTDQPRLTLTDEEVNEFLQGVKDSNENESNENETPEGCAEDFFYVSKPPACPSALLLPYNSEYEIDRKQLIFDIKNHQSKIGNGNFGQVYKGQLAENTNGLIVLRDVAIKTIDSLTSKLEDLRSLINEIKVISYVGHHPNIVEFIGACTLNLKRGEVFSVMELCCSGSLKAHLETKREAFQKSVQISIDTCQIQDGYCQLNRGTLHDTSVSHNDGNSERKILDQIGHTLFINMLQWARDIAAGMEYLRERNVLHIDLAARNILLSKNLTAKICDFGLSRKLYDKCDYEKSGKDLIPFQWIALECMTENKYSASSDVWAYAVTLWEIFNLGREPYSGKGVNEIFGFLQSGNRLLIPSFATLTIYNKMLCCWNKDPALRPTFSDLKIFFEELLVTYSEFSNYSVTGLASRPGGDPCHRSIASIAYHNV